MRGACAGIFTFLILAASLVRPSIAQEPVQSARAARIQNDLRQILSSPEFSAGPTEDSLIDRAGKWIRSQWTAFTEWLDRIFSFGGRVGPGASQFLMWIVLAALIVGIAYVLAYGLRRMGMRTSSAGRVPRSSVSTEQLEERIDDPDSLLAIAGELAAAGQFKRAYRAIFLAILLRMDRQELIRFDRARTNGEYLRSLRSRPEVLTWMKPLTYDFDVCWYGGKQVEEPDYRRALGLYERLTANAK
jgi:hypothetical protein